MGNTNSTSCCEQCCGCCEQCCRCCSRRTPDTDNKFYGRIEIKDNEQLNALEKGSLLEIQKHKDSKIHWAVFIVDKTRVGSTGKGENNLKLFSDLAFEHLYTNNRKDMIWTPYQPDEIEQRAEDALKKRLCDFNLLTDNCQDFAYWCRYGKKEISMIKIKDKIRNKCNDCCNFSEKQMEMKDVTAN